jgi:hypothetical protein
MNYISENPEIKKLVIIDDDDDDDFDQTISDKRILESYKEWKLADTYKYQVKKFFS